MATRMIDYACDDDGDLAIENGDFVRAESTAQHQTDLIECNKGEFKENPTICVGAINYIDDETIANILPAIAAQFAQDGMQVDGVQLTTDGIIKTNAYYK